MNTNINSLDFNGAALTVITHAEQRWLTAEQVGRCLGYAEANMRQGIISLYNRHVDEFTDADTCVINLISQAGFNANLTSNPLGGNPNTRVFSSTGCTKLGFFASTPRAKEFRTWASRVLAGQPTVTEPVPAVATTPLDRMAASMEVMADNMAIMANGVDTVLTQMNVTGRYITMLEMHQRGHAKVTPELRDHVQLLAAQGMPLSSIARLVRLGKTTVWNLAHGTYPTNKALAQSSSPDVAQVLEQMIEARKKELLSKGQIQLQKQS